MDTGAHGGPDATTNRKKRNGNRPTTATIKGKNEPDNFAATSNRHSNNHESTEHQAPSTDYRSAGPGGPASPLPPAIAGQLVSVHEFHHMISISDSAVRLKCHLQKCAYFKRDTRRRSFGPPHHPPNHRDIPSIQPTIIPSRYAMISR